MPLSESGPYILSYSGVYPSFVGLPEAPRSAAVLGRVTMGRNARLAPSAVIRADGHYVSIGDDFWLGAHGTVHIAHDVYPTHIGDNVTVGANAIVHACDVGSNCVIGHDVVILDGSKIGDNVVLEDSTIVYPRSSLDSGWLYSGRPAKPVRKLDPQELNSMHRALRAKTAANGATVNGSVDLDTQGLHFIAETATLRGKVALAENVGVWFGCALYGNAFGISVGNRTNCPGSAPMAQN